MEKIFKDYLLKLSESKLFLGFSEKEVEDFLICSKAKIDFFSEADYIDLSLEENQTLHLILEGKACLKNESGRQEEALEEFDFCGEVSLFSADGLPKCDFVFLEKTKLLRIQKKYLLNPCQTMCKKHKLVIRNLLQIIVEKLVFLENKVSYLEIKSMRKKLCKYLLDESKRNSSDVFELPFKRAELADFLNVSRPSMSRELSRMKKEGLIDYHLSKFYLKNKRALEEF